MRPTYKSDIHHSEFPAAGSRLVYGTAGLGGIWGKVDPAESVDCLHYAWEHGITSVDTAPSYNHAESYLGKALKSWKGERPFISSKVGRLQAEEAFDFKLDFSRQGMMDSIKRTLDLIGVDQLDLLFLHEPQLVPMDQLPAIIDTLKEMRELGYTKLLGVGGNPTDAFRTYIRPENFQVISGYCKMDASNLSAFEKDIPLCREQGVHYYAASPLHFALLGNRYSTFTQQPPDSEHISAADIARAKRSNQLAQQLGMPLPSMSHRFLFSIREATRVVIGARNISQITDTMNDWKLGPLPQDVFEKVVDTVLQPVTV